MKELNLLKLKKATNSCREIVIGFTGSSVLNPPEFNWLRKNEFFR
jgi:hypothetical protein